jgi:putative endonuclease
MRDVDGTLVFVEVKTRSSTAFGVPAEAVVGRKARRLRVLARHWLREGGSTGDDLRFDVVGIVRAAGRVEITHLRGVA